MASTATETLITLGPFEYGVLAGALGTVAAIFLVLNIRLVLQFVRPCWNGTCGICKSCDPRPLLAGLRRSHAKPARTSQSAPATEHERHCHG